jgi:hypothetical protein
MQHGSLAIVSRKLARLGAIRTRLLPVARWPCCWQSLIRGGPGLAPAPITVAQLCDHFEQRELAKDNTWRS